MKLTWNHHSLTSLPYLLSFFTGQINVFLSSSCLCALRGGTPLKLNFNATLLVKYEFLDLKPRCEMHRKRQWQCRDWIAAVWYVSIMNATQMCKFESVCVLCGFLHAALCACGQLTDGKQTRTLSSWFITDISASDFAMSQKRYTRQSTQEHNRMTDCTKRRSAWLGQCKHPIAKCHVRLCAAHTRADTHWSRTAGTDACTWPNFIVPMCPLFCSVCCV